jgi:hypothetical protein
MSNPLHWRGGPEGAEACPWTSSDPRLKAEAEAAASPEIQRRAHDLTPEEADEAERARSEILNLVRRVN